ncbi:MAG: HypC/HybG/HupF family hydrogenase formation chaperone [Dehalococcoidia bacterium]|nr:HypC/HybG/HupF family hydrogenase formation chaperone [Dehalococcoidia bacterium]MDD5493952.1 HypC/HybG/HupF family hydrogenase formation chaperone [Dehalococcoidia bacterium]
MCLAVPVKIVSIEGDQAEVDIGGVSRRVSIALTPEAAIGDYVLLHTGYAINVLNEAEARETLDLLERMVEADEAGGISAGC